jgi:hypothetical protein
MSGVGRYVKMTARAGRGEELAETMVRVAESLLGTPGLRAIFGVGYRSKVLGNP